MHIKDVCSQSRIKKEVNRVGIYSKEQEVFIYGFSIRIVKNKDGTQKHQRLHNYSDQLNIFKIVIVSILLSKTKRLSQFMRQSLHTL